MTVWQKPNQRMATLIYANANSLFDYSNGAARSLRLLLEAMASSGTRVFAITSCVSDSQGGCRYSQSVWSEKHQRTPGKHPLIQRFIQSGVHHTLIFSKDHRRQQLTSQAQELIYREAELILSRCSQKPDPCGFLSWGNLLLEEALYQRARGLGISTFFYLANPSYRGKPSAPLKLADLIFTDSKATQRFYQGHTESPIQVLPKIIAQPSSTISADKRWAKKTVSLINPCLKKGLKQFIALAHNCQQSGDPFHFLLIDAAGKLDRDLHKLQLTREQLPANIQIRPGTPDTDLLLADSSILMLLSIWHESGSRLIHEAHQRSIPVLAFATGGTPELMQHTPADLFPAPDNNSQWDPSALTKRLRELLGDRSLYGRHAKQLQHHTHQLETANRAGAINALQQALQAPKTRRSKLGRQI